MDVSWRPGLSRGASGRDSVWLLLRPKSSPAAWRLGHGAGVCPTGQRQHGSEAGGCQRSPPETPGAAGGDRHGGRLPECDSGTVSRSDLSSGPTLGLGSPSLCSVPRSLLMEMASAAPPSSLLQCFFLETPLWVVTSSLEPPRGGAGREARRPSKPRSSLNIYSAKRWGLLCFEPSVPRQGPWGGRSDPEGLVLLAWLFSWPQGNGEI